MMVHVILPFNPHPHLHISLSIRFLATGTPLCLGFAKDVVLSPKSASCVTMVHVILPINHHPHLHISLVYPYICEWIVLL